MPESASLSPSESSSRSISPSASESSSKSPSASSSKSESPSSSLSPSASRSPSRSVSKSISPSTSISPSASYSLPPAPLTLDYKWEANELPETLPEPWYGGYYDDVIPQSIRQIESGIYHWLAGEYLTSPGNFEDAYVEQDFADDEITGTTLEIETRLKIIQGHTLAQYQNDFNAGYNLYGETHSGGWIDTYLFTDGLYIYYDDENGNFQEFSYSMDASDYHVYKFHFGDGTLVITIDDVEILNTPQYVDPTPNSWNTPFVWQEDNYDGDYVTEHYIDYLYTGVYVPSSPSPSASPSPSPADTNVSDPALNGVYTLGNYGPSYPQVLDLTYPLVQGSALSYNQIEIGSIVVAGDAILVSWYDHAYGTKGVSKVDWDNKIPTAFIDTKLIPVYRRSFANYAGFIVAYASLPSGAAINIYYSKNYGDNWILSNAVNDIVRKIVDSVESIEATQIQTRLSITTSGNNAPIIETIGVKIT
jgi:hypothetical protein